MPLLILGSGAEMPVNILATQVHTPRRSHSPSEHPRSVMCVVRFRYLPKSDKSEAQGDSPTYSSAYSTPCKFQLRQPGLSCILLARSAAVPAEMGVGSLLKPGSVLAY